MGNRGPSSEGAPRGAASSHGPGRQRTRRREDRRSQQPPSASGDRGALCSRAVPSLAPGLHGARRLWGQAPCPSSRRQRGEDPFLTGTGGRPASCTAGIPHATPAWPAESKGGRGRPVARLISVHCGREPGQHLLTGTGTARGAQPARAGPGDCAGQASQSECQ